MPNDEFFALFMSGFIGWWGWSGWSDGLFRYRQFARRRLVSVIGWTLPVLLAAIVYFVLRLWGSHDVREAPLYLFFYLIMWFGWAGLWHFVMIWFDIDFRDAASYGNSAMLITLVGGLLAVTFIFAGGNIGEGPGWYVVVFCAGLGTATLLVIWLAENQFSPVHDWIAIDRDLATAWRNAGFFVAAGLILGRAVAGDWRSVAETIADFVATGWPVLLPAALLLVLNLWLRPTPSRPAPSPFFFGVLPAVVLVAIGLGDLLVQGPWQ